LGRRQVLGIKELAQGHQSFKADDGLGGIANLAARHGIKHPRRDGNLQALRELDDQTI
jgi:hypothetical protein